MSKFCVCEDRQQVEGSKKRVSTIVKAASVREGYVTGRKCVQRFLFLLFILWQQQRRAAL
jgi:hypothetical protein